jgi:hypothetical protein
MELQKFSQCHHAHWGEAFNSYELYLGAAYVQIERHRPTIATEESLIFDLANSSCEKMFLGDFQFH